MMFMNGFSMGGWMWLTAALTFVLFWGGVYLLARGAFPNQRDAETPMDILRKRLASGEISKAEFEEIRAEM